MKLAIKICSCTGKHGSPSIEFQHCQRTFLQACYLGTQVVEFNPYTYVKYSFIVSLPVDLFSYCHYDIFISHRSYRALHCYVYICLLSVMQGSRNPAAFPPEVIEAYKYTFSRPGALTAALNYYRSMFSGTSHLKKQSRQLIEVPTLIIWV